MVEPCESGMVDRDLIGMIGYSIGRQAGSDLALEGIYMGWHGVGQHSQTAAATTMIATAGCGWKRSGEHCRRWDHG